MQPPTNKRYDKITSSCHRELPPQLEMVERGKVLFVSTLFIPKSCLVVIRNPRKLGKYKYATHKHEKYSLVVVDHAP
jgi:hypothetical protein